MQTKIIIAAVAAVVLVSAGAGLGVGWLWWGSGTGATEYADSNADVRLGDIRAGAVGDTDESGADLGVAIDGASRTGSEVADVTEIIAGEYRDIGNLSSDITGGITGDAELAGQIADIIREGAHSLERGTPGDNESARPGAEPAGPGGEASGDPGSIEPP